MPKPVKKKKRFISKKESTTYKLVPGYVPDDDDESGRINETPEEFAARKEEERKFGVFYNDDYNYMKHLRSFNEEATMISTEKYSDEKDETRSVTSDLPLFFEMFSTDVQEGEVMDADVLAALDDAPLVTITEEEELHDEAEGCTGLDSFLDDDFISKAGGVAPKPEPVLGEDDEWSDEEEDDEECDDSDFGVSDNDDDVESETMSVLQHGDGRGTLQDDIAEAQTALILRNFEEGLGFHHSNQMPDFDPEPPTDVDYEHLKHILQQDMKKAEPVTWSDVLDDRQERAKVDTSKYLYEDEDEIVWKDAPKPKPKFDCVSILSLNSNTRNLPTDILPPNPKPKKSGNSGTSTGENESDVAGPASRGLSLRELEQELRESRRADCASTFRPQGETAEEKRARKKAIKDERKERRQEKKGNKLVFSMENEKMKKETAALAKSVKSVKIS